MQPHLPVRWLLGGAVLAAELTAWAALAANDGVRPILISEISHAPAFGTFQSHNQKVVANDHGIFLTYLHADNEANPKVANEWRLMRSVDGGRTFTVLYEGRGNTRAPALETDHDGNLLLACPEYGAPAGTRREFRCYRFAAAENYRQPHVVVLPDVPCAAKYALAYDPTRHCYYVATQYGQFLTLTADGQLRHSAQVLQQHGPEASTQYPWLFVDAGGTMHHAWTTAARDGTCRYPSVHYLRSRDGCRQWEDMCGTPVVTPAVPDRTGPSTFISRTDEGDVDTWLGAFCVKAGMVHCAYYAGAPLRRQHYVQFEARTGIRRYDSWVDHPRHKWCGTSIALVGVSGLLATHADRPAGPLFAVQQTRAGAIGALRSDDNGRTWRDHARSQRSFNDIYALGGCRWVTEDGQVIGSFTARATPTGPWRVYFFCIPTNGPTGAGHRRTGRESHLAP